MDDTTGSDTFFAGNSSCSLWMCVKLCCFEGEGENWFKGPWSTSNGCYGRISWDEKYGDKISDCFTELQWYIYIASLSGRWVHSVQQSLLLCRDRKCRCWNYERNNTMWLPEHHQLSTTDYHVPIFFQVLSFVQRNFKQRFVFESIRSTILWSNLLQCVNNLNDSNYQWLVLWNDHSNAEYR